MEYALDARWSVEAEGLYVDLGKNSTTVTATVVTGRFDIRDTMWIVLVGANYKFGS
jgi:opacity protein-like surface antigen